jgi:hypothetical protein
MVSDTHDLSDRSLLRAEERLSINELRANARDQKANDRKSLVGLVTPMHAGVQYGQGCENVMDYGTK